MTKEERRKMVDAAEIKIRASMDELTRELTVLETLYVVNRAMAIFSEGVLKYEVQDEQEALDKEEKIMRPKDEIDETCLLQSAEESREGELGGLYKLSWQCAKCAAKDTAYVRMGETGVLHCKRKCVNCGYEGWGARFELEGLVETTWQCPECLKVLPRCSSYLSDNGSEPEAPKCPECEHRAVNKLRVRGP